MWPAPSMLMPSGVSRFLRVFRTDRRSAMNRIGAQDFTTAAQEEAGVITIKEVDRVAGFDVIGGELEGCPGLSLTPASLPVPATGPDPVIGGTTDPGNEAPDQDRHEPNTPPTSPDPRPSAKWLSRSSPNLGFSWGSTTWSGSTGYRPSWPTPRSEWKSP